ncbi:helix-turn-helix domain-containing protein [Agrobacterium vaccinii]|uniref:transcriptional regulator n=1 Tax=Agrobacterium vaccinii TaxID=2735528 RepID=UPI001E4E7BEF|nr:Cro/CI family transcriptional regulator [Agrobacterium vaccinii]UHS62810.1 helix-turn-helix domain-containing protein [Agrobacterium vaccinii]
METVCEKAKDTAGGPAALAKALGGVTPQAVSQWKKVPAERVLEVERVTGISRHELRPDVFGVAETAA